MTDPSVEDRIKGVLIRDLKLKMDPTEIPNDMPLIGKGLGLDSVSVLQLVGAIERSFNIRIDDDDIGRDLFRDIATISDYVRRKQDL